MSIEKIHIRTAFYAARKRLAGYHLLQNPKGTPQTEVNMIKTWDATSYNNDKVTRIWRIKKTFSKDTYTSEEERFLSSTHYFDSEKKQITKPRKKDIIFDIRNNHRFKKGKVRHDLQINEAMKIEHQPIITVKLDQNKKKTNFFKVLYQNLTNK